MHGAVGVAHVRVDHQVAGFGHAHKAVQLQEAVVLAAHLPLTEELHGGLALRLQIGDLDGIGPGGVGAIDGEYRAPAHLVLSAVIPFGILVVLGKACALDGIKLPVEHINIVFDQLRQSVVAHRHLIGVFAFRGLIGHGGRAGGHARHQPRVRHGHHRLIRRRKGAGDRRIDGCLPFVIGCDFRRDAGHIGAVARVQVESAVQIGLPGGGQKSLQRRVKERVALFVGKGAGYAEQADEQAAEPAGKEGSHAG